MDKPALRKRNRNRKIARHVSQTEVRGVGKVRAIDMFTQEDVLKVGDIAKKAEGAVDAYSNVKKSEIEAFLLHFDLLWRGCGYMPRHVSSAIDQIQRAVAINRAVLEGYMGSEEAR